MECYKKQQNSVSLSINGFVILLFLILKFWYTKTFTNDLLFLLAPTNQLLELFIGSNSTFIFDQGYFFQDINVLIDRSCAGINFWLISSIMLFFLIEKHFELNKQKFTSIFIAFTLAYLMTIVVNTSRIIACLFLEIQSGIQFNNDPKTTHQLIGIITNLSFLVLSYLIIEHTVTKIKQS